MLFLPETVDASENQGSKMENWADLEEMETEVMTSSAEIAEFAQLVPTVESATALCILVESLQDKVDFVRDYLIGLAETVGFQ